MKLVRVKVVTGRGTMAKYLSRVWLDDQEIIGVIDVDVALDETYGQMVTLRLAPEVVEWLPTEPVPPRPLA